jgi:hypothetical protein
VTFLECINLVLRRLREASVTSWDQNDYSQLVGRLVNDAKREIENVHMWTTLKTQVDAAIVANATSATFTGTNNRTRIIAVYNDTDDCRLTPVSRDRIQFWREIGTESAGAPQHWSMKGWDSSEDIQIELYPKSGGSYTLTADAVVPQDDLAVNGTVISVPGYVVYLRASALALAERGDDQGQSFAQLMNEYQIGLNDAVVMDQDASCIDMAWVTP